MEYRKLAAESVAELKVKRQIFDRLVSDNHGMVAREHFTIEDAERLVAAADAEWLNDEPAERIRQIMDDIEEFRQDYYAKYRKQPSDRRIYAAFRIRDEASKSNDSYHAKVIDALMGGVKDGKLPEFERRSCAFTVNEIGVRASTVDILI